MIIDLSLGFSVAGTVLVGQNLGAGQGAAVVTAIGGEYLRIAGGYFLRGTWTDSVVERAKTPP